MRCHIHTCMPSKQPAVLEQTNFSKWNKRDTVYFTVIKSSGMTEAVTGFQKPVSTMAKQPHGGSGGSCLQGPRWAVLSLGGNSWHFLEVIGTTGASLPVWSSNPRSPASPGEAGSKKEALHSVGIWAGAVPSDAWATPYKCLHASQTLFHLLSHSVWVPERNMGCIIFETLLSQET